MPANPVTKPLKILVVEDCVDTQDLLSYVLQAEGMQVDVVGDGRACIETALGAAERNHPYSAIVMDMGLPDADGLTVTRNLRLQGYEHPIFAVTIEPSLGKRAESLHAGCDGFLAKRTIQHTLRYALEDLSRQPSRVSY